MPERRGQIEVADGWFEAFVAVPESGAGIMLHGIFGIAERSFHPMFSNPGPTNESWRTLGFLARTLGG